MSASTILIAEHHPVVVDGLRRILDRPEFEVVGVTSNGRDLVRCATQVQSDLIITAIDLPLQNGIDAVREIISANRRPKIIFFTMHAEVAYAMAALAAGASGYVLKSAAGEELINAIRDALKGRAYVSKSIATSVERACEIRRMASAQRELVVTGGMRQAIEESWQNEDCFRDLFEEAPIAYLYESVDSRIIRANRTAMRVLGVKPEEIEGMFWKSLVANTPDTQERLRLALEGFRGGIEASGVVLELHRKDDGRPIWIEWWSRPIPGSTYTRTMFIDITDRVLIELEKTRLEAQNTYLLDEIRSEHKLGDMIGVSASLRKVMQKVQLVAPTNATVLITGASGTGKELVARAIHQLSTRNGQPLIKLNCSAVPEGLFESEFFGHVKGSFTGAHKDKPGRFELADGGTLFLDEVGEVPLAMQAKLLRVLQEQELERIGDTHTRKVNVRVIAATNRDLTEEVDAGRFREDLYYRLRVFPIEVPALRERPEDIAPLAAHFIRQSAQRMNRPEPQITHAALTQLNSYDWPGNVRQLQNVIERSIILWQEGPLVFDLPALSMSQNAGAAAPLVREISQPPTRRGLVADLKRQERDAIVAALQQANGKISGPRGAAELLGMKPSTLSSRMSALGLSREILGPGTSPPHNDDGRPHNAC